MRANLLKATQTADEGQELLRIPHHQLPKREKNSWQQEGGEAECNAPDLVRRLRVRGIGAETSSERRLIGEKCARGKSANSGPRKRLRRQLVLKGPLRGATCQAVA